MFSNQRVERFDDRQPEFLRPLAENSRVQQIRAKIRTPTHEGKPVPKMKAYNIRDAIFEAMLHRFAIDPTMIAFGEENRDWGGAFAVYRGLTEALPCPLRRDRRGRRSPGAIRSLGRGDRPAIRQSAELRFAGGFRPEDR